MLLREKKEVYKMEKFPIIITRKDNNKVEQERVVLEATNVKNKDRRSTAIKSYENSVGLNPRTLCMDCTLDMTLWPKMRDIAKKKIEDYDFIIAGYQIQDVYDNIEENISYKDYNEYELEQRLNDLRIERFAVKECTLFKKNKKR